jgi:hypothetical protein
MTPLNQGLMGKRKNKMKKINKKKLILMNKMEGNTILKIIKEKWMNGVL